KRSVEARARFRKPDVAFSESGSVFRRNSASGLAFLRRGQEDSSTPQRPSPTFQLALGHAPRRCGQYSRIFTTRGSRNLSPSHFATGTLTAFPTSFQRLPTRGPAGLVQPGRNPCRRSASVMSGLAISPVGSHTAGG